ncbi:6711_t:CDS:2 [Gigaspora rosea]|nr:6711_t:CDS:2 [Gigaspora rosea]
MESADDACTKKITVEDAKRILNEQTTYLQKINTEIQEYTSNINDLRFECENLEKENEELSKERELYESQAVKSVSKMNNRSLQETYPKDQFKD